MRAFCDARFAGACAPVRARSTATTRLVHLPCHTYLRGLLPAAHLWRRAHTPAAVGVQAWAWGSFARSAHALCLPAAAFSQTVTLQQFWPVVDTLPCLVPLPPISHYLFLFHNLQCVCNTIIGHRLPCLIHRHIPFTRTVGCGPCPSLSI